VTGRVAILARVSTLKRSQDESPDRQIEQGKAWADRKGFEVVGSLVERASGAKGERERPALAEVLRLARSGKIDHVWVARLDRLGRSMKGLIEISEELKELGVGLCVDNMGGERVDTTTAMGKMMFTMSGGFAEFQRDMYAEAAAAGKERARKAGKICNKHREVIPPKTRELIASYIAWMEDGWTEGRGKAWTWGGVAARLKEEGHLMPGRSMADGSYRPPKPWDRTTLKRAYGRPAIDPGKAET